VDTSWKGSVLLRDIDAVKRLREEDGPNLVTQGSTELVHALFANDLVDQLTVLVVPVVLGRGKKLFADGSVPHAYRLTRSRVAKNGLIIAHYDRAGEVRIDDASVEILSDAERKRRERMKREG
jgi:dihydrofolate reductase